MDHADSIYLVGAVLFLGIPLMLAVPRIGRGFKDDEDVLTHTVLWLAAMVTMYVAIGLTTYIFTGTAEVSSRTTGMSNTEKLIYAGLATGTYEFRQKPAALPDSYTGFYGYVTGSGTQRYGNVVYQDAQAGSLTHDFWFDIDPSKTRVVAVANNFRVVLRFRQDDTRNPRAFADGTAVIPHYPSGCRLVFKVIWPTCAHDVYTEKVMDKPVEDLDLQSLVDKDLVSETFYVPASFARIYHPGR